MQEKEQGLTFVVATDGSKDSTQTFLLVADSIMDLKKDTLIVAHIYDDKDDKRPNEMRSSTIKENIETHLLSRLPPDRYVKAWEKHHPPKTKKEQITEIASTHKADLVACGFHGRKGPKEDSTVMGTTVSHITEKSECPTLIVKDFQPRAKKEKEGYHWVVCTDGSEKSRSAFGNISRIMDKEKDTMEILAVKTAGFDTSKLAGHCEAGFEKNNIKGKVTILENDPTKKIENIILEYIHDEKTTYVDFVSIGRYGEGYAMHKSHDYIGSVAMAIIRRSHANVIVSP